MLATGAVHLSALRQISRFLTDDNHMQLLERVRGKSKRDVEKLVAELDPKPDMPSQMRKLPQRAVRGGTVCGKAVAARAHPSVPVAQQLLAAADAASVASAITAAATSSATTHAHPQVAAELDAQSAATADAQAVTDAAVQSAATAGTHAAATTGAQVATDAGVQSAATAGTQATATAGARVVTDADAPAVATAGAQAVTDADAQPAAKADAQSAAEAGAETQACAAPSASCAEFVLEAPRERRGSCTPLGTDRYGVKITVDEATHEKLQQLQHLLRHRVPNGDIAVIIELGLNMLLAQTMKQRFGIKAPSKTTRPTARTTNTTSPTPESDFVLEQVEARKAPKRHSRHIPRAVLPEVYTRDQGQCSFISADGHRCTERGCLEVHHIKPFARGGEATVANLKIMCRAHNALLAEQDFGRAHIHSKRSHRRSKGNRALARTSRP